MAKRIVLVEDEQVIRENYVSAFRKYGYEVMAYASVEEAERGFQTRLPDLAILDVGLGDEPEGGFKLCQQLRQQSNSLPIMFLTALDSDFDVISGLRLGADDYVTKDISLPHLMARIAALLRRVSALQSEPTESEIIEFDSLKIDVERIKIYWQQQPVELTLTEFWMVHALAKNPGHVKTRDQLMETANVVVDDTTITSHIKRIRKKFIKIDSAFDCIDTVYGMGYRWKS
ncbi:proteobacterial dedicated sortase system response regulator [Pleionea sp. CnH1-48]|uniref:proteobacterial dedicated sortase system response regulator n=1 Tax=Pleionea sp. CnH1-48 TaxID=2954494 RepID=UPI002097136F|nr:proteobacterial dedicated sortase system response regulator [Pleionea sp. CnH1-48]MCO7223856.1 proteobacterial dedicated sortase system response regulator [Pleionea sp. CnH1-48]